ncbi:MAG: mannosyltransferase family protein [Vicinamibacterales bacterium]
MTGEAGGRVASTDAPTPAAVPSWRRATIGVLDVATLLAGLALLATVTGEGVRLVVAGIRVSVTTPWRPLAVVIVLAAWRHWLQPSPSQLRRGLDVVGGAWRSRTMRDVVPIWLASRASVLVVGYLAVILVGFPVKLSWRISDNEFLNLPARWDAGWYLQIAYDGYRWNPDTEGQQNIAFFPAYPLMMRTAAALVRVRHFVPIGGNSSADMVLATDHVKVAWIGVVLSLVCFLWALVYLHRLARLLTDGDVEAASGTVLMLAAYPFALFYGAVYTEALFLLSAVAAFYHLERDELGRASVWGLVAGLARPNGCVISVPLALVALRRASRGGAGGAGWAVWRTNWQTLTAGLAAASASGVAMLAFTAYLYGLSGRWFLWLEAHRAWGRTYQAVDQLFAERVTFISQFGFYEYTSTAPYDLLNALPVVVMLLMAVPVWRRLGLAYAVFLLVNLVPPLAAGGFLSMGRVTSVMFPVFVYLGGRLSRPTAESLAVGFAVVQGLLAALFFTWRPLY